ncbi:Triose-phosphate Transporter [Orbilia brochopaga]|uniref:Triose-phosphate Transporter n=1 Tax=Orbilia brochopaga TaxID=3140254 RepID=A0AAV9UEG2_9PEZI
MPAHESQGDSQTQNEPESESQSQSHQSSSDAAAALPSPADATVAASTTHEPPPSHTSLPPQITSHQDGDDEGEAEVRVVPASRPADDTVTPFPRPPSPIPASSSASSSSSPPEMPGRITVDVHARRRSRGQSISTSFSPIAAHPSSNPGTPTDRNSPTARTRAFSQPLQNANPNQPAAKEGNTSPQSQLELNTLSSGDSDEEAGLTESARDRRRKKKLLRRGLGGLGSEGGRMRDAAATTTTNNNHHHIHVPEEELAHGSIINGIAVTRAEKRAADKHVLKDLALNALLIGMWYLFSLLISLYNKWMFSDPHLNFKFPLFVTSIHMLVQFTLSGLVMWYFVQFRPGYSELEHRKRYSSSSSSDSSPSREPQESRPLNEADSDLDEDDQDTRDLANETQSPGPKKPIMTKLFYVTRIAPCGMATGLDIGLGNMSLKHISLTFYTMCKSSSLAFVLIFAFIFRLEKPTIKLIAVIMVMTAGVVLMVSGEAVFVPIGFVLVMLASMLSGLRWSLTQLLLLRNPATSNPFSSIFFLAPVMFLSILVIAIPVEGVGAFWGRWLEVASERGIFAGVGMLIAPGIIAFCMTASEFALLRRTSVVTLSICGIFKEVVTISASATIFHDILTPINIGGLLITILSIASYNYIKISKMRGEAVRDVLASEAEDAEGRRSLLFERRSLALNRASLDSERRSGEFTR